MCLTTNKHREKPPMLFAHLSDSEELVILVDPQEDIFFLDVGNPGSLDDRCVLNCDLSLSYFSEAGILCNFISNIAVDFDPSWNQAFPDIVSHRDIDFWTYPGFCSQSLVASGRFIALVARECYEKCLMGKKPSTFF